MTAFTHPKLTCWVCEDTPAAQVVEAKVLVDRGACGEIESHYRLSCTDLVCVELSAIWADSRDRVHVDTYPIRSRAEAEAISGLDLGVAR